jgi:hypothetical protein
MSVRQQKDPHIDQDSVLKLKSLKIKSLSKNPSKGQEGMKKPPLITYPETEGGITSGRESRLQFEYDESMNDTNGTFASMQRVRSQSKVINNPMSHEITQNPILNAITSRDESQLYLKNDQSYDQNFGHEEYSPIKVVARKSRDPFTMSQMQELEKDFRLDSNEPSRILDVKPVEIVSLKTKAMHLKSKNAESSFTPSISQIEGAQPKEDLEKTTDNLDKSLIIDKSYMEKSSFDKSFNEKTSLMRGNTSDYEK